MESTHNDRKRGRSSYQRQGGDVSPQSKQARPAVAPYERAERTSWRLVRNRDRIRVSNIQIEMKA